MAVGVCWPSAANEFQTLFQTPSPTSMDCKHHQASQKDVLPPDSCAGHRWKPVVVICIAPFDFMTSESPFLVVLYLPPSRLIALELGSVGRNAYLFSKCQFWSEFSSVWFDQGCEQNMEGTVWVLLQAGILTASNYSSVGWKNWSKWSWSIWMQEVRLKDQKTKNCCTSLAEVWFWEMAASVCEERVLCVSLLKDVWKKPLTWNRYWPE